MKVVYKLIDNVDVYVEIGFEGEKPVEVMVYEKDYDAYDPLITKALAKKIAYKVLKDIGYDNIYLEDEDKYSFILERYHFLVHDYDLPF